MRLARPGYLIRARQLARGLVIAGFMGVGAQFAAGLVQPAAIQAQAQAPAEFATLIADRLLLDGPDRLIAEGNVEIFFGDAHLKAARVVYDRSSGALSITGPLVLTEGSRAVLLAESAELSDGLRRGIITSARVVLDQQLQIAASSVLRRDDRFTELNNAIASSCEICAETQTPLWEVRAARVVHDQQERQIYFEQAQFRLFGLPVAYIPRLRVPDPTLSRATGFLSPDFSLSSAHGAGVRLPYFIALSHDRDLTLIPYLTSKNSRALELRYRQAFSFGMIELGGEIARDRLRPGSNRGFAYAEGEFTLPRDFVLRISAIQPSDRTYLDDYGRGQSRLTSEITLSRVQRDERIEFEAVRFRSLRPADVNRTLPNTAGRAVFERRADVPGLGGVANLRLEAHAHARREALLTPADPRPERVARLSLDAEWRRDAVLPGGAIGALGLQMGVDHVRLSDTGGAFPLSAARVTPNAMLELRWPLMRAGGGGATHIVEPVAQLIWSRNSNLNLPNDASRMPEFDEGNLFSYDRFAGRDAREAGRRANLGVSWTRHDPAGWSSNMTLGRIYRAANPGQFSAGSPLDGARSNWLLAASVDTAAGLTLSNRALFTTDMTLARNALELDWSTDQFSISTSYLRVETDLFENRPNTASEWSFDGTRALDEYWTAAINWRYDIAQKRAARAGVGLTFENECLRMGMQLERDFAAAATLSTSTSFGLSIDILGIGGSPSRNRRACAQM